MHVTSGPLGWAKSFAPVLVCVALALALQLLVKPLVGDFYAKLILDIGTNVILAVSLTMVNGFTGQFSMGHAAFMLVGAYTAATLVYYGSYLAFEDAAIHGGSLSGMSAREGVGLLTWADGLFAGSLLAGGLVAALCGYLVGLPSLRLRGDYLAIVTLGFGEIARVLIQSQTSDVLYDAGEVKSAPIVGMAQFFHEPGKNFKAFFEDGVSATDWSAPLWLRTGGALGFSGLPFYTNLFWVFLVAGLTMLVAFRLKRSTFGRAFLSIREDEIAAEAMGVGTTRYKVWAFVISAFFAGVAGGLFAHTSGVQLNPGELGFMKSFDIIIMVVLGGLGSISGAALAAGMLTVLPEWLRAPGHVWWYGLVIAAIAGASPLIRRQWREVGLLGLALALVAAAMLVLPAESQPVWKALANGAGALSMGALGRVMLGLALAGGAVVLARGRGLKGASVVLAATLVLELARYLALSQGVDLSKYRMILYAFMLILMMILRPKGLLGVQEVWDGAFWRGFWHSIRGGSGERTRG